MTPTKVVIERDIAVPMRDGTILRADVWRPDGAHPAPAILFRTPYNKKTLNADVLRPQQCVDGGYVAVVQDTRGRFASEGDWDAIMWRQEGIDTYDSVEWVATQPWCDGAVGMAGPSYLAIVQWMGAMQRPPHLRAIAPTMSTCTAYDAAETGGAIRLDQLVSWLVFMAADWLRKQLATGASVAPETIAAITRYATVPSAAMEVLPLRDLLALPDFPVTMADLLSGEIDNLPDVDFDEIGVPTLSVGGCFDLFCGATVAMHQEMTRRDPEPERHCLVMGPWAHAGTLPSYQGELNFGLLAAAPYAQVPEQHLQFFEVHLKGAGTAPPPVRYYLAGANEWRTAACWPPSDALDEVWFLRSGGEANTAAGDGVLSAEAPTGDEPGDTYRYDPADPVPSHGGRALYLGGLVGGPFAQNHLESRSDVLCYTTAPLEQPLDAVGPASSTLFATTSATDTDFVAKLIDVFPDGRSVLVADGAIRARYRKGFGSEHLVEPGVVEPYPISLGHTAWRFDAGHRVRLHLTSSNFPQLDRNMNTGRPIGTDTEGVVATQHILHDGAHPSQLQLSVLPPEGR